MLSFKDELEIIDFFEFLQRNFLRTYNSGFNFTNVQIFERK